MKKCLIQIPFFSALLLLIISCQGREGPPSPSDLEPPPLAVEALTVSRGKLVGTIVAAGIVKGINEANIVSQTQGIIEGVNFDLGDRIGAEQILVKVDDTVAYYSMVQAQEQWETALLDLGITEKLFNDGKSSRADLSRARSAANGSRAAYEMAAKTYRDSSLRSPIEGFVAEKQNNIAVGNYISPGNQVARIVDLSSLKMEITVGEREITFLKPGYSASVVVPTGCPDVVFAGAVDSVAAGSNPVTGSYSVIVVWENSCGENIKSGMSGSVTVETAGEETVTLILSSALTRRGEVDYVYINENGQVRQRRVTAGRRVGNRVEVLEGLSGGEELIISGLSSLKEGTKISPKIIGESGSWR